jgi:threonine dehydrogenase-like Zn-dependent dehydrogenase
VVKTPSKCVNNVQYGFFKDPDKKPHFSGCYAQYIYLHNPKTDLFKIKAPSDVAVLTEPLAVALHGVTRAQISLGKTVIIQGAGPIRLLTVMGCKTAGAGTIIVIDKGQKGRLELATELGAHITIDIDEMPSLDERIQLIKESSHSGYVADAAFECVGIPDVVPEGLKYIRDSDTYCIVGNAVDLGTIPINPCLDVMYKNIRVEGIFDHTVEHFIRAVSIIEKGEKALQKMVSHKISLYRLSDAVRSFVHHKFYDGKEVLKPVVDPWLEK